MLPRGQFVSARGDIEDIQRFVRFRVEQDDLLDQRGGGGSLGVEGNAGLDAETPAGASRLGSAAQPLGHVRFAQNHALQREAEPVYLRNFDVQANQSPAGVRSSALQHEVEAQ